MIERIALILRTKNINASQFADEIGVQRSSISHVLSGRNKPSLEFVQKVLKRYPDINPDWLLFGKGAMHQENNLFSSLDESIPLKEEAISKALGRHERVVVPQHPRRLKALPEEEIHDEDPIDMEPEIPQQAPPKPEPVIPVAETPVMASEPKEKGAAVVATPPGKTIEKILVFYSDKSFREYSPE